MDLVHSLGKHPQCFSMNIREFTCKTGEQIGCHGRDGHTMLISVNRKTNEVVTSVLWRYACILFSKSVLARCLARH